MQNDTLSYFKQAFSIGPQVSVWIDVSLEGDGSDFEFFAWLGDRCVAICNVGPGEADLSLGKREFPTTGSASGTGSLQPGHCTFMDQPTFKLGQCREDAKRQPACVSL